MTDNVFEKAIEILQTYGHVKGISGNPAVGYCALGALNRAFQTVDHDFNCKWSTDWIEATAVLKSHVPSDDLSWPDANAPGYVVVQAYNDRTSTSAEDIILMFKKAAVNPGVCDPALPA